MQKYAAVLFALFMIIFISGCGGTPTAATSTIYDLPTSLAPSDTSMGGAVQGTVALVLSKTVSTIAGTAGTAGIAGSANGVGPGASFNHPTGITTDGSYLYVADYNSNMIRKIAISDNTNTVTTLAGNASGIAGYADSTDGTGNTATFNHPTALTVSGSYLYVADTGNNIIRKVNTTTGAVTVFAGSTTGVAGSIDSKTVPTDARFNQPTGITTDGVNLYITDAGDHTIRMIVIASKAVSTLAGSPGSAGSIDGAPSVARFNLPSRITTDRTYLYVTDFNNRTIRRIEILTGNVTTIAGVTGPLDVAGNVADGAGTVARFYQPNGITTDGINLYVTDSYNNSIRMIANPTGQSSLVQVTTLIHGTGATAGFVDGLDGTTKLNTPIGITTDGTALFVADSQNNAVRKLQ